MTEDIVITKNEELENTAPPVEFSTKVEELFYQRESVDDWRSSIEAELNAAERAGEREEFERLQGQKTALGHLIDILDARVKYHEAREKQA